MGAEGGFGGYFLMASGAAGLAIGEPGTAVFAEGLAFFVRVAAARAEMSGRTMVSTIFAFRPA